MIEVRLLGQCTLVSAGMVLPFPSRPARLLLAYLILNRNVRHSREHLAAVLWPDSTPANARSNLRHALWRLRTVYEEVAGNKLPFIVDDDDISFDRTCLHWLDVAMLEAAVEPSDDTAALIAQVRLYRGELMPGYCESWVVLERERLKAVYDLRMEALLERLAACGDWPAVITGAEQWLSLGHLAEPAYRYLMLAHAGRGNLAQAAMAYQRCRDDMLGELETEPSVQTQMLAEMLFRGQGTPDETGAWRWMAGPKGE